MKSRSSTLHRIGFLATLVLVALAVSTPLPSIRAAQDAKRLTAVAASTRANGKIAISANFDGFSRIYLMNPDGTGLVRLTNTPTFDTSPSWSPDGSRIAYVVQDGRTLYGSIFVMNADGSNQTRLTSGGFGDFEPVWSPDGTKIAFLAGRPDIRVNVHVMKADGSDITRLTANDGTINIEGIDWSPDGQQIIYQGPSGIHVMNADGSSKAHVPGTSIDDGYPAWSPDGTKIAFTSNRESDHPFVSAIFVMNADGSGPKRLSDNLIDGNAVADDIKPAWSPDGTKISFMSNRHGNWRIFVMNADGSGETSLTNAPGQYIDPAWRPTGSKSLDVSLLWTAPDEGAATPPRNLTARIESRAGRAASTGSEPAAESARGSALTGYKVYRAAEPNVALTDANLLASVPPTQTRYSTPLGTAAGYFVVTACYEDVESPGSNEVSAGTPGPSITSLNVTRSKIVGKGTGFTDSVAVFVDGISFENAAIVKKQKKVTQKGLLSTGQSISQYFTPGLQVEMTLVNTDQGVTRILHTIRASREP